MPDRGREFTERGNADVRCEQGEVLDLGLISIYLLLDGQAFYALGGLVEVVL